MPSDAVERARRFHIRTLDMALSGKATAQDVDAAMDALIAAVRAEERGKTKRDQHDELMRLQRIINDYEMGRGKGGWFDRPTVSPEAMAWLRYESGDFERGQAWGQDADGRAISEYAAEILKALEGK